MIQYWKCFRRMGWGKCSLEKKTMTRTITKILKEGYNVLKKWFISFGNVYLHDFLHLTPKIDQKFFESFGTLPLMMSIGPTRMVVTISQALLNSIIFIQFLLLILQN